MMSELRAFDRDLPFKFGDLRIAILDLLLQSVDVLHHLIFRGVELLGPLSQLILHLPHPVSLLFQLILERFDLLLELQRVVFYLCLVS